MLSASWQIIHLLLMKIALKDMMNMCNKHEHTQHLLRLWVLLKPGAGTGAGAGDDC